MSAAEKVPRPMEYFSDFRDLLSSMQIAGVRFLVVGAHALAVHGVPRATVDLDVWVECTPDNAAHVMRALTAFGAPVGALDISLADFTNPDMVVQLGLPPVRIDLMTGISGVSFEEAWSSRVEAAFADLQVSYIGRAAFLKNKRASGRKKDLSDIEQLGEEP